MNINGCIQRLLIHATSFTIIIIQQINSLSQMIRHNTHM